MECKVVVRHSSSSSSPCACRVLCVEKALSTEYFPSISCTEMCHHYDFNGDIEKKKTKKKKKKKKKKKEN